MPDRVLTVFALARREQLMADNHEMWKNLGMDLETHDQLCAVLPTAFGDVYLSQENRPEGMAFTISSFLTFTVSDLLSS